MSSVVMTYPEYEASQKKKETKPVEVKEEATNGTTSKRTVNNSK